MSEPGPATLYKLGNLIKFYQGTIGSVHLSNYLQVIMHICRYIGKCKIHKCVTN